MIWNFSDGHENSFQSKAGWQSESQAQCNMKKGFDISDIGNAANEVVESKDEIIWDTCSLCAQVA